MPYKRGFTNRLKAPWEVVSLTTIDGLDIDGDVTPAALVDAGVVRSLDLPVKILGGGEITRAVTVKAHAFSKSAQEAIEGAGGSVETIERDDQWTSARPRSRRLPLNRELKQMRVGKVGGPSRREALKVLSEQKAKEA
jgi:ribosomal protein L18E